MTVPAEPAGSYSPVERELRRVEPGEGVAYEKKILPGFAEGGKRAEDFTGGYATDEE